MKCENIYCACRNEKLKDNCSYTQMMENIVKYCKIRESFEKVFGEGQAKSKTKAEDRHLIDIKG